MALNWKALAPHRPLDPGEPGYVSPPSGFAERIASLVGAGTSTVLVAGPVGVGKSTELVRIAALLQNSRVACLVQLDRHENIRRLTPDQMLLRIAGELVALAEESLNLRISPQLAIPLADAGVLPTERIDPSFLNIAPFTGSASSLARAAMSEVARRSPHGRIALVIDGLEKMPDTPQAREVLAALHQLGDDIDLITVVPWFAAFGALDDEIRPGAHLAPLPAPIVDGPEGERGREFLIKILAYRLGLPTEQFEPRHHVSPAHKDANLDSAREVARSQHALIVQAARWSGGLPRTFLQLMADAAQYALIRRGEDWPSEQDLADAVADQKDSFRRVLLPGDTDAIIKCDGTDGREMELGRKIRLLARGVILERQRGDQWFMEVHPLVRPLLGGAAGA